MTNTVLAIIIFVLVSLLILSNILWYSAFTSYRKAIREIFKDNGGHND